MKKFISILLSVIFTLSCVSIPTFAQEKELVVSSEVEAAIALGILDVTAAGRVDENMTRGEFFGALSSLLALDESAGKGANFTDLPADNPYYDKIIALYNLGFINGYGDGTLRPDEPIEASAAVRLLCYAIGYKDLIDAGKKVADAAAASDICSRGLAIDPSSLSVKMAAKLLLNTGNALVVSASSFQEDNSEYLFEGKTVFEKYADIYIMKAIVTSNEYTSIDGTGEMSEKQVKIGGQVFNVGTSGIESLIGCYTTAYYTDFRAEKPNTVLYAYADERDNKIIEVPAEDCIGYDGAQFNYYDENENKKSVKFKLNLIDLIYNNRVAAVPKATDFNPSSGFVKIIDNNSDGTYDVVEIRSYSTVVVDFVDIISERIYGKEGTAIDLTLADDVVFTDIKGKEAFIVELAEWDVLAFAESKDGKFYSIVYVPTLIDGMLESYNMDDPATVVIDEKEQKLSDYAVAEYGNEIRDNIGKIGEYGIDIDGKIAYVNFGVSRNEVYGYIRAIAPSKGISPDIEIKYMDSTGETHITKLAERVVLNGERLTVKKNIEKFTALTPQVILYKTNINGEITYIDTAYKVDRYGNINDGAGNGSERTDNTLHMFYDCFKPGTNSNNSDSNLRVRRSGLLCLQTNDVLEKSVATTYGSTLVFSDSTLVFDVARDSVKDDDETYRVQPITKRLGNDQMIWCRAYKRDADALDADIILLYRDASVGVSMVNSNEPLTVISEKLKVAVTEDGEAYQFKGFYNGGFRTYTTRDLSVLDNLTGKDGNPHKLQVGDVVQLAEDFNGKIIGCKLVYACGKDDLETDANPTSTNIYDIFRLQLASVYKVSDGYFITTTTKLLPNQQTPYLIENLATYETRPTKTYQILVYNSEEETLETGTAKSLIGYMNSGGTDCSRVFLNDSSGDGRIMVIYK